MQKNRFLIIELLDSFKQTKRNKRYLESVILLAAILEFDVRDSISIRSIAMDNEDSIKKYSTKEGVYFSTLVDYLELLDENSSVIESLRKFNTIRNSIIHKMFNYQSLEELNLDANKAIQLGQIARDGLSNSLMNFIIDTKYTELQLRKQLLKNKKKIKKVRFVFR